MAGRSAWQPSWTPDMLDPEFAVFIFFPMATLLTLGFFLWACDGWPDDTVAKRLDRLRPKYLMAKMNLHKCPECLQTFANIEPAQEHWEAKHKSCGSFDMKQWKKDSIGAEWFFHQDHLSRNNLRQVDRFQGHHYECNRMSIYSHILTTSPFKVWKSVFLAGLASFFVAWLIVNGVHFNIIDLETCFRNMEACVVLLDIALPFASFTLAFYVTFRLWRFNETLNQCTSVQCSLEEIAFLVGYSVSKNLEDDELIVMKNEAMFLLSQYLNLVHQLVFLKISKRFERYNFRCMVDSQLITEEEKVYLTQFKNADTHGLAIMWIGHLITKLLEKEILEPIFVTQIMRGLAEVRRTTSSLMQEQERKPPLSFLQLTQIAADATCMASPLVILYKLFLGPNDVGVMGGQRLTSAGFEAARKIESTAMDMMYRFSRASIYLYPALGTMLVTLIYQSILQMTRDIEEPFAGLGPDNLNADTLLQGTEMRIAAFLTKSAAPLEKVKLQTVFEGEVEEVDLKFKPGRLGFEIDGKTGQLWHVSPETQAWKQGVRASWKVIRVNDRDFTNLLLNKAIQGSDTFSITFIKKAFEERAFGLGDFDADLLSMPDRDEVASMTSSVAALMQPRADGRPTLPTAVVLSAETLGRMATGADQDAHDLQASVHDRLAQYNVAKTQKKQEELYWVSSVEQMLPKLEKVSEINARLREQIAMLSGGVKEISVEKAR